jgi:ferredoxin
VPIPLTILKVWIEPGCIVCNACESDCPEVFLVEADGSTVRPEALDVEFLRPLSEAVRQAAEECPVEVIKFQIAEAP